MDFAKSSALNKNLFSKSFTKRNRMNFKNLNSWYRALYIVSAYYLVIAILGELQFFISLLNNIISSEDSFTYFDYVYRLGWLIFLLLIINSNYRILFKTVNKKDLVINIIFSSMQIIGFHILYIAYYSIFGLNIMLVLGFQNGIETQIVFSFSEIKYALMYIANKDLQFISIGFIPLIIFYINLKVYRMEYKKKSSTIENVTSSPV